MRLTRELASSVNFMEGTIPPVREIVIVISDLYLAPGQAGGSPEAAASAREAAAASVTLRGFEHAARFGRRRSIEGEGGWRPWLARWLGRDDLAAVAPAVIAAATASTATAASTPSSARTVSAEPVSSGARTASIAATDSTVWIATPVHLIAGLTSLHVDRRSILRLSAADLESFAQDFNRTFGNTDLHLAPLANGEFLMRGAVTLIAATTEPSRVLVADLETALPKGSDSKALKRLGAEIEMWLHAHPLNESRRHRGELPVSTLWLWGGGALANRAATPGLALAAQPPLPTMTHPFPQSSRAQATQQQAVQANSHTESPGNRGDVALGSDPYLTGLWHLHGDRVDELPDDKLAGLLADPHVQRSVLVTEVTPMLHTNPHWTVFEALAEIDHRYVAPAIAALRTGTVEKVVLIANDTELQVTRHDRLKFWRRRQPTLQALRPP
jgi:hypothetical protein